MKISIDWLSISFPDAPSIGKIGRRELPSYLLNVTGVNSSWVMTNGRKPFNMAFRSDLSGAVVYGYSQKDGILLECGGRAMDFLENHAPALVDSWLTMAKITRIDIACDYERRVKPSVLCAGLDVRTLGSFVSDTGETIYIGSQKSDKFTRVYLYNEPHERADSTRVETVYRREYAEKIARMLATGNGAGVIGNIKRELELKGFNMFDDWRDIDSAKITMSSQNTRDEQKTLLWLRKQVAPSIKRLLLSGVSQETILANIFPFVYSQENEDTENE